MLDNDHLTLFDYDLSHGATLNINARLLGGRLAEIWEVFLRLLTYSLTLIKMIPSHILKKKDIVEIPLVVELYVMYVHCFNLKFYMLFLLKYANW